MYEPTKSCGGKELESGVTTVPGGRGYNPPSLLSQEKQATRSCSMGAPGLRGDPGTSFMALDALFRGEEKGTRHPLLLFFLCLLSRWA